MKRDKRYKKVQRTTMDRKSLKPTESKMDKLMHNIEHSGGLEIENSDQAFDFLMSKTSTVKLSSDFRKRALEAVSEAQLERERQNPFLRFGSAIVRAREQIGLRIGTLEEKISVSARIIDMLELGELSVRQIIQNFPPMTMHQLLTETSIALDKFRADLLEMVSVEVHSLGSIEARDTPSIRRWSPDDLINNVSEYISTIEEIAQTGHLDGP